MKSEAVHIEPGRFLEGWRPESGTLFLPALTDARVGDEAVVRVGIVGQTIRATLFGKIALVRRVGRPALPPGVELKLDRGSVPAAAFLAMSARGEPVSFRDRAPRYAAERPLRVEHAGASYDVVTLNVSDGGCALRWPNHLPSVGEMVSVRIGSGFLAPTVRAVVCWTHPGAGGVERSIGVRLIVEGRAVRVWAGLVAEVARSGARTA
ncbi:MAG TPA: PilZ domain-containing protein [Anaeromyxobacteraceae bacterium]|nr:PilZ domain-containing protein [Anaeromyxobacteraceae bacterium]